MEIGGRVKVDHRTKNLIKRLQPQDIAVIDHADLDELAALALVKARVKAVINAQAFTTGRYPNMGPLKLLDNHIVLLDEVGPGIMQLKDGQDIMIKDEWVYLDKVPVARGKRLDRLKVIKKLECGKNNLPYHMEQFVNNTLYHALVERSCILGDLPIPELHTSFQRKHVLIVVRGQGYQEDLLAIKSYIREMKPVLVGVDGGADALLENGYRPDLIVGDMDSSSDKALNCGAEIVVHAYPNGHAPGLQRVQEMGLQAKVFAVPGTSEDAAMLLAYHGGSDLIAAVGTHTNMIDFFEKGRQGMASTLLTRIKVGSVLVDAKGVSKLYGRDRRVIPIFQVAAAAVVPLMMIATSSKLLTQLGRLLILKFKLLLGI